MGGDLQRALGAAYTIERELGAGGMATVYLAHDRKHDRDVAIKVLHPDLGAALGGERFLSEIRTTARLQHPHILPLIDSGEADGLLYYVMPFVTGETLRARLTREQLLPIDDAVTIAREVADALGYAHSLGVIHRDIKPENILLQNGHALVADFGIALAVQSAGGQRMTQTGLSLGTPQYMSPEQAMGERVIDARTDIYSLGAVTYEMLAGETPFTGPTVQAIVARILTEEPRALASQRKAVPDHVEVAVLRALEKLPADRFATAADFATALRDGSANATSATKRRGAETPAPAPLVSWWTRPRLTTFALALTVVGATAGWTASRLARPAESDAVTMTSIVAPIGGSFGEGRSIALSPDGRRIAFVFTPANGPPLLWVRNLDRLNADPLPRTAGADAPFWSPDGRSLGYFAGGFLNVLGENGEPRRLCPVADPTGGSWNTVGLILFGDRAGLSTVPAGGGSCRRIVSREGGPSPRGVFLPDGQRFIYARGLGLDMAAANLDGVRLATFPMRVNEFAIAPPGYLLVPSATDPGGLDARRINLRTLALEGPIVRISSDVRSRAGVHTIAVSSNGAFLYLPGSTDRPYLEYDASGVLRDSVHIEGTWTISARPRVAGAALVAVAGNRVGVWLYDLDADRATRLPVRDSAFNTSAIGFGTTHPAFSSDGKRLVFAQAGGGRCRIIERDLTTDAERIVMRDTASATNIQCPFPLDWSSDGKYLLVRRDTLLEIVALDGGRVLQRLVRPGRIWEGKLSPDGRAVAYSSDETGRAEVYVQRLPANPPAHVSLEGGRWPIWTHGGRLLTFMTPDGRVQEVTFSADPSAPPGTPRTRFAAPTWRRSTFDDHGVGFAVVGDGERYMVRASPSGLALAYVQNWLGLLHPSPAK